jgi:hypothetical protein
MSTFTLASDGLAASVIGTLGALFGALIGVGGGVVLHRYTVGSERVKNKYASLRSAYANHATFALRLAAVQSAHAENLQTYRTNRENIEKLQADLVKQNREPDRLEQWRIAEIERQIDGNRRAQDVLNIELSKATLEVDSAFMAINSADVTRERLECLRQLRFKLIDIGTSEKKTIDDAIAHGVKDRAMRAVDGIVEWTAKVAIELDQEERRELDGII